MSNNDDNSYVWFVAVVLLFLTVACVTQITSSYYIAKHAIENGYEQTLDGRWIKGEQQ
jgi:hypothetical protein